MSPSQEFHDAAVRWATGHGTAADVVRAACDALAVGPGGTELALLAGVPFTQAEEDLRDFLPSALQELGLPWFPLDSREAGALKVMASRVLAGVLMPRELAAWTFHMFGRDQVPLAGRLVDLQDEYDDPEYGRFTSDELDDEVRAEAQRILASPPGQAASLTTPARPCAGASPS